MRDRAIALAGVVLLAIGAVWLLRPAPVREPAQPSVRRPLATPTSRPAPSAVTPTPTAEPLEERRTTVVVPWESTPMPTPTEPEPTEPPTPRRAPSATPGVEGCVAIRWSSEMSPVSIGQVLVEIHAVNRCGRDLAALDVWFGVAGYRNGDLVQTTTGHLFDPLARDGEGKATLVLPGSSDWYDEIRVAVLPPGAS